MDLVHQGRNNAPVPEIPDRSARGRWPFLIIALGLIAYALYELLNARYRTIKVQ